MKTYISDSEYFYKVHLFPEMWLLPYKTNSNTCNCRYVSNVQIGGDLQNAKLFLTSCTSYLMLYQLSIVSPITNSFTELIEFPLLSFSIPSKLPPWPALGPLSHPSLVPPLPLSLSSPPLLPTFAPCFSLLPLQRREKVTQRTG